MADNHGTPPTDPDERETATFLPVPEIPARIGPYRILEKLGEGGMGVVYLAQQEEPIRRRVALKVIKPGMDSEQVLARFSSEKQALALMSHPNVAKVFDAGTTERGLPYFVMEHVPGIPITSYCDQHRLTNRQRLELFIQVYEAIQHAHQKGIIHRDIKPSNVLVSVEGEKLLPKVIDFGVAKATGQQLTERTLFTRQGVLIGTPEYMSPEQAGTTTLDIDTRTDIYSLGVLLYELLVGALPFEPARLRLAALDELLRIIREEEPQKPSTRISSLGDSAKDIARRRHTDNRSLSRQLCGDLDWIVMKALEKERTRRYRSPHDLASDVRRHLTHQPVEAGPPSATYRVRKFVRRNKLGVGFGAVLTLLLVGFGVTMAVQARRVARERDRANQEAATAEQVSEFLADMLGEIEPEAMGSLLVRDLRERIEKVQRRRGATDEEIVGILGSFADAMRGVNATDAGLRLLDELVLERAAKTIEEQLAGEPVVAARLEHTLGTTYRKLGMFDEAEPHILRAMEIRARVLGHDHPDTLRSRKTLADLYVIARRLEEAESLYQETIDAQRRILGDDHPDTLTSMHALTYLYGFQGRFDEVEPLTLETLEARKRVLGDDHPDTLASKTAAAHLHGIRQRFDEAEALYLEVLETRKRLLGDDHPETLKSMKYLAINDFQQGRYDDAESQWRETLRVHRRVLGNDHFATVVVISDLAILYGNQGRYKEAEPLCLEAVETYRRVLGDDHPETLNAMSHLAALYVAQGRDDEAKPLYVKLKDALGDDYPDTAEELYYRASQKASRNIRVQGLAWLRQAVDAGWTDAEGMAGDSRLESIHGPEFDELVERARRNAAD